MTNAFTLIQTYTHCCTPGVYSGEQTSMGGLHLHYIMSTFIRPTKTATSAAENDGSSYF